jgi:uncharacterized protein YbaR (Trm112 family)
MSDSAQAMCMECSDVFTFTDEIPVLESGEYMLCPDCKTKLVYPVLKH